MTTNITINTDIVSVCQGIGHMQDMNKLLSYISCLYHKKHSPPAIKIVKEYPTPDVHAYKYPQPPPSSLTERTTLKFKTAQRPT